MDKHLFPDRRFLAASALLAIASSSWATTLRAADDLPGVAKPDVNAPVTVTDHGDNWVLDNGIVKATINKNKSNMPSLVYHGVNTMGPGGFWEQTPSGRVTQSVTIDPATNGGQRGEVDIKGVNGKMDIEVRYALQRGVSGIYTYAMFSHPASYPAAGEGESRFDLQLNPTFDWLSVDADRNMLMCSRDDVRRGVVIHAKEQKILASGIYKNSVEHKYSYCGVMYKLPAYGWSSRGRATTWTVKFNMDKVSQGKAALRLALAGADGNGGLAVGVNGQPVGTIQPVATNALRYNTDTGVWYEYVQKFDAALLKAGENSITLTVPAGDVTSGVVWDYLRLELDDSKVPVPPPAQRRSAN